MMLLLAMGFELSAQQIVPYSELNQPGRDDQAITFRTTCDGMEMWLTREEGSTIKNKRMVFAKVGRNSFESPVEAPFPLNQAKDRGPNTQYLDGTPRFNGCDPNYGVFTSNRLFNNKYYDNDIYEMILLGGTWKVNRIDEVCSDAWDDSPSLSQDGRFLYFASARKRAGTGETDLYVSTRTGSGKWSNPEPLDMINEPNVREQTPFAAPDGYLYYATDKSGDDDIWRIRLDESTGKPIGSPEQIKFAGVNKKGTREGHPAFSPGMNWFIFSSDRGDGTYDLFYTQINDGADTLHIQSLFRTRKFNKDFEEYEDVVEPYSTSVTASDLFLNETYKTETDASGKGMLILPRNIGKSPSYDRRIREVQVTAITKSKFRNISSTDTLVFELGHNCKLEHTLFIWDLALFEERSCTQNFPITNVEFFVTGYWCPTTYKFSKYTDCQSVFFDKSCLEVPEIEQPCPDNDLFKFQVTQPRIDRVRRAGLCANLSEVDKFGKQWSTTVDSALIQFVYSMKSALKKPCLGRAINQGKPIKIEVIGWTDPRALDNACLYTGSEIDFNTSKIKLEGYREKSYLDNGILRTNTRFTKSPDGGNKLLSEVRAYFTAQLLDKLWQDYIPAYKDLRDAGFIEVYAVGRSISKEKIDMARQRSVNVRISAEAEEEFTDPPAELFSNSVALCGNDCLKNLVCRRLEETVKPALIDVMEKKELILDNETPIPILEPAPEQNYENKVEKPTKQTKVTEKPVEQAKPIKTEKPVEKPIEKPEEIKATEKPTESKPSIAQSTPAPKPSEPTIEKPAIKGCYTVMYLTDPSEAVARDVQAKLQGQNVEDVRMTVYIKSNGEMAYRVLAGCFKDINDANYMQKQAKIIAERIGLSKPPIIIKE